MAAGRSHPRAPERQETTNRGQVTHIRSNLDIPTLRSGAEIRAMNIQVEWLIDGIVPKKAITLKFGRGGIGKTTLAMQLGNAVSCGKPFLGRATKQVPVIYVDFENPLAILSERLKTIGGDDILFWTTSDNPASLDKQSNVYFDLLKQHPDALFIFDILRSAQGGDENEVVQHCFCKFGLKGQVKK